MDENIKKSFELLQAVYDDMPKTKGCNQACSKNGCRAWCCEYNTPHSYTSEFSYLWENLSKTVTNEVKIDIIVRAVKNYLRNSLTKTCIFFDKTSCKCMCHTARPLACRMYGIVPPNSWRSRVKSVKENALKVRPRDKKDLHKVLEQCDIVRTSEGHKHLNEKKEDALFARTKEAEKVFGVTEEAIKKHDDFGGSYRAMHDHLMLTVFPTEFLSQLSDYRMNDPSEEDIKKLGETVRAKMFEELNKPNEPVEVPKD